MDYKERDDERERLSVHFSIRLTPSEHALLERLAGSKGHKGAMIRALVLGGLESAEPHPHPAA